MKPKNNPLLDRKPGLYLKDSANKEGNGLFCKYDIAAGEELETTPAIILNDAQSKHVYKTILWDYVFRFGPLTKKLREKAKIKKIDDSSCVVMGIASYCNSDRKPNAEVIWDEVNGVLYYSLRALKKIPKNTEICTTYGEGWFDSRD
jgi:hypothetical protein